MTIRTTLQVRITPNDHRFNRVTGPTRSLDNRDSIDAVEAKLMSFVIVGPLSLDRETSCAECDEPMFMSPSFVPHHGHPGRIDYDRDARHVALVGYDLATWTFTGAEDEYLTIYEALIETADIHDLEFGVTIKDSSMWTTYHAGDQAWFAEQQARKGIS